MFAAAASPAFIIIYILWLAAGAFVYIALVRQIAARRSTSSPELMPNFGAVDSFLAAIFIALLLYGILVAFRTTVHRVDIEDFFAVFIETLVVIFIIVGLLQIRRRNVLTLAGLTKLSALRAILTGALLLFFAFPLLHTAELILQRVYGSGLSNQSVVDFFNASQTLRERIIVIIFAIGVAPMSEEFFFRFFIYGVLRRHFGVALGLVANSLLFAAAHGHLPSLPLLFILGVCCTLAYEWSGSLLVNMAMHALFNAASLSALAFPQLSSQ